jgi:hypothetical protein
VAVGKFLRKTEAMTEPMPQFPPVRAEPVAEYTQEQYEAYLRYQAEQQAEQRLEQQQVSADTGASFQPIPVSPNTGANVQPTPANAFPASSVQPTPVNVNPGSNSQTAPVNVNPGSGYQSPPGSSAPAGSATNQTPKSSAQQWPTESTKESAKESGKDSSKDSAKESAKEAATVAKETASAVFGEVKSAVSIASKREPYALLAVASAGFTLLWLIWRENDTFGAEKLKLWTVFVIASVALVFTPIVRKVFRLDPLRAWQFAVGGASGLGFAWVAFLLPNIDSNQAFFGTLAVAAGGLAAWTAPGRPE